MNLEYHDRGFFSKAAVFWLFLKKFQLIFCPSLSVAKLEIYCTCIMRRHKNDLKYYASHATVHKNSTTFGSQEIIIYNFIQIATLSSNFQNKHEKFHWAIIKN